MKFIFILITSLVVSVSLMGSNIRKVVWKGELAATTEVLTLTESTRLAMGTIIGTWQDQPITAQYTLHTFLDGSVQSVSIYVDANKKLDLFFESRNGFWRDRAGNVFPEWGSIKDVDINLTPYTNTLAIKRLQLEVGQSKEIPVLYFDLTTGDVRIVRQRYTHVTDRIHKYENLDTGFSSLIEVDEESLVTNYPGIWRMIFPGSAETESAANDEMANQFAGSWKVDVEEYLEGGERRKVGGEFIFSWVPQGSFPPQGNRSRGQWRAFWFNFTSNTFSELRTEQKNDRVFLTGEDAAGNLTQWIVSDFNAEKCKGQGFVSTDNGKTWALRATFFGRRSK